MLYTAYCPILAFTVAFTGLQLELSPDVAQLSLSENDNFARETQLPFQPLKYTDFLLFQSKNTPPEWWLS